MLKIAVAVEKNINFYRYRTSTQKFRIIHVQSRMVTLGARLLKRFRG